MLRMAEWDEIEDVEDLEDAKGGNCFYLAVPSTKTTVYKIYLNNNTKEALCVPQIHGVDENHRRFAASVCLAFGYTPKEVTENG